MLLAVGLMLVFSGGLFCGGCVGGGCGVVVVATVVAYLVHSTKLLLVVVHARLNFVHDVGCCFMMVLVLIVVLLRSAFSLIFFTAVPP